MGRQRYQRCAKPLWYDPPVTSVIVLAAALVTPTPPAPPGVVHHTRIAGRKVRYTEWGSGEPALLLHGGGRSIQESFAAQIPALSGSYRVIAPERDESAYPLSYANMTEETVAFLDAIGVGSAHVIGWSDGGVIGLLLAARHPDHVRSLVVSGANMNVQGLRSDVVERMKNVATGTPDSLMPLRTLWLSWDGDVAELEHVAAPTLVFFGDHDIVREDQVKEILSAIPNARPFFIAGAGHDLLQTHAAKVNPAILEFLAKADTQP